MVEHEVEDDKNKRVGQVVKDFVFFFELLPWPFSFLFFLFSWYKFLPRQRLKMQYLPTFPISRAHWILWNQLLFFVNFRRFPHLHKQKACKFATFAQLNHRMVTGHDHFLDDAFFHVKVKFFWQKDHHDKFNGFFKIKK